MSYSRTLSERIYSSTRPEYGALRWQAARRHILLHDRHGVDAIASFLVERPPTCAEIEIMSSAGDESASRLASYAGPAAEIVCLPQPQIFDALAFRLASAETGIRLCVCGTQAFLSRVERTAFRCRFPREYFTGQVAGPSEWDIQCAYCKTIYPDVTHRIARCDVCEVDLLVRNHYSIAYGAYQAVFVSPEDSMFLEARQSELVQDGR
ncbi:MAG: hypothetical protein DI528_15765 [Shinella sp.]|nr:MAG: hypothetical protein DI528_15765 [Shinella sp.]